MNSKSKIFKKSDIFYHIVKGWRIIILFTLAGLIAGVGVIGFGYVRGEMTREYKVNASIAIVALNAEGEYPGSYKNPFQSDVDFARDLSDSVIYIIKSRKNLEAVVDEMGGSSISAADIGRNLSVTRYQDTEILELTLLWRTENEGMDIMDTLIKVSDSSIIDILKIGKLSVINEPKANFIVGGNISLSTWIYAAVAGFIVGVLFCILRFILSATVVNEIDLEEVFGMDSLGAVPLDIRYARSKPLSDDEEGVEDNIKSVAHLLINRLELAGASKVYFTSTIHSEGKSRMIADVALQFSYLGKKTLLIDCNFKNPTLGALFDTELTYEQSLNSLYRGESDILDAVVNVNGCLDLLPAVLEEDPESFNDAMLDQIARAMTGYDFVLIDTSPVGVDAEVLRLNEITDAVVFVVRCDFTKVDDIKKALFRLGKSDIPIAGGIFNCLINWRQTVLNTPRHLLATLNKENRKKEKERRKAKKEAKKKAKRTVKEKKK